MPHGHLGCEDQCLTLGDWGQGTGAGGPDHLCTPAGRQHSVQGRSPPGPRGPAGGSCVLMKPPGSMQMQPNPSCLHSGLALQSINQDWVWIGAKPIVAAGVPGLQVTSFFSDL